MIRTLLPNQDAVFQYDNPHIHIAGTVQSLFEEHECELQHLPRRKQSLDLNITAPLRSVLEARMKNRYTPLTLLKQLEDSLQEEWYRFLLGTVQNLYESIPKYTAAVLKTKDGPTPY
jgi:hypothetical protein